MLTELRVRDLGVIADLTLVLGRGMTALTGETGAGKTLVVEAIELLLGGRADPVLVRPGATEAVVEGRFVDDAGEEVVLARTIPSSGRSRGYVDGHMAPASVLAETGERFVDLHGQHAHQSLLQAAAQREALDAYAGIDLAPLQDARADVQRIAGQLSELGGDTRARAREIDLLRFQLQEIEAAGVTDPDEDAALDAEEDRLADASASREAAAMAHQALVDDDGAADAIGQAIAALAHRPPLAELGTRLRALAAETADAAAELRDAAERLADDPERLSEIRARRQLLRELRRKYGDTLADVISFAGETRARLDELESYEQRAAVLEQQLVAAGGVVADLEEEVAAQRRVAAPKLGGAVEAELRQLALPRARFDVSVGDAAPGDEVVFLFGANPGEAVLPLTKVASGGELARVMLALRLVLSSVGHADTSPPTLVFDEVDAGIGGEAAVAVGRALAALGARQQVLVVTHLAQVAAFAGAQVAVAKVERKGRTIASATPLDEGARVVELSRMLSGQPDSERARQHAEELLAVAASHGPSGRSPRAKRAAKQVSAEKAAANKTAVNKGAGRRTGGGS